jgi:hypothetical protein
MCPVVDNPLTCEICAVTCFLHAKNMSAVEIQRELCTVYGQNVPSEVRSGVEQPFSTVLSWRNSLNNFQLSGNPCIKIIMKVGSGFNINKGCKLILISTMYNMKIY